jgi:hypothetical protein
MWANYFGNYVLTMAKFKSTLISWDPGEDWYNPGFLMEVDDNVTNINPKEIFNGLSATSIGDLKTNLKKITTEYEKIDVAYNLYSDWP